MKLTGTKEIWEAAVDLFWNEVNVFGKVLFAWVWPVVCLIIVFSILMDLTRKPTP